MRILSSLLCLLLLLPHVGAYPELKDWVTDEADVLTDDEELDIWATSEALYKKTGAQLAVLVVDTTYPDDIVTYGVKVFEENGIGSDKYDDGVLILVSVGSGEWRIEVGYGLEGYLPDALVNRLAQEHLVPYLNASDYYTGLFNVTFEIASVLWDDYMGDPPEEDEEGSALCSWWIWGVIIVLVIVLMVATRGRAFWWILLALSMGRIGGGGGGGFGGFGGGRSGGGGARGGF